MLAGAAGTAAIGFWLIRRYRQKPFLADTFRLPAARDIDRRLLLGAAIFGVGWGLVGLCPGPALAALSLAFRPVATFVAAMLAGMVLFELFGRANPSARAMSTPAGSAKR